MLYASYCSDWILSRISLETEAAHAAAVFFLAQFSLLFIGFQNMFSHVRTPTVFSRILRR